MYVCRYCRYYRYSPGVWGWRCSPSSCRSRAPAGRLVAGTTPATLYGYFFHRLEIFLVKSWLQRIHKSSKEWLFKCWQSVSKSPNKCHKCVRRLSATTFHQSYGPIFSLINFISPEISDRGAIVEPRLLPCYQLVSGWKYKCCTIATEFRVEKTWRENRFYTNVSNINNKYK